MERWRNIKDYPTYRISSYGRVSRTVKGKRKILCTTINDTGYTRVNLYKEKVPHPKNVHRLVAEAFIENPNNYKQVNHINNKRDDNRVDNLEWCTNKQNMIHAYKYNHSKVRSCIKESIPIRIVENNMEFESIAECSRFLGCKGAAISKSIKNNRPVFGFHYEKIK